MPGPGGGDTGVGPPLLPRLLLELVRQRPHPFGREAELLDHAERVPYARETRDLPCVVHAHEHRADDAQLLAGGGQRLAEHLEIAAEAGVRRDQRRRTVA